MDLGVSVHIKTDYMDHRKPVIGGVLTQLSFRINTLKLGPKKAFIIEAGPEGLVLISVLKSRF